jgi:hypothetical protein
VQAHKLSEEWASVTAPAILTVQWPMLQVHHQSHSAVLPYKAIADSHVSPQDLHSIGVVASSISYRSDLGAYSVQHA